MAEHKLETDISESKINVLGHFKGFNINVYVQSMWNVTLYNI